MVAHDAQPSSNSVLHKLLEHDILLARLTPHPVLQLPLGDTSGKEAPQDKTLKLMGQACQPFLGWTIREWPHDHPCSVAWHDASAPLSPHGQHFWQSHCLMFPYCHHPAMRSIMMLQS